MAKPRTITDQIRDRIETCGRSRYRISKDTGITQGILSRFINHKAGMSSDNLDRLAAYLGLAIVVERDLEDV